MTNKCCSQGVRQSHLHRNFVLSMQAEWHSSTVAVKMLKRSDSIAMNDFRTELDVLQKVCTVPKKRLDIC